MKRQKLQAVRFCRFSAKLRDELEHVLLSRRAVDAAHGENFVVFGRVDNAEQAHLHIPAAVSIWGACHTGVAVFSAPEQNWFLISTASTTRAPSIGELVVVVDSMSASASLMSGLAVSSILSFSIALELGVGRELVDPTLWTRAMKSRAIGEGRPHTFLGAQ